jgi:pSer/pThr/pTyr-binding forkhead associated (FHA) protein
MTIDDFEATILAPRRRPWTITGPDGIAHPIRVPTVIGRAPQRPLDRSDAEVLPLADPTKSLSKSHAIVELDADGFAITDLGSTNGIVILDAAGHEVMLPVGVRVPVDAGTRLELGDFVLVVDRS